MGCLPFTWADQSVHGVGKWFAKFRPGKFRPGIAFTICTNQLHLPENDREGLKLFGIIHPEKQDYLFRYSVAPGNYIFRFQRVVFYLLSGRISRKIFVNGIKQP